MRTRVCTICEINKSIEDFFENVSKGGRPRAACKECLPKLKEYKGKNKELRKRYGISVEDYNKMFSDQKGSCAICKVHQSKISTSLHVDHCHKTHKVRGLLCFNCNMALGRLNDSVENLENAIKYLMHFNDK
jgi:hypothetical protein